MKQKLTITSALLSHHHLITNILKFSLKNYIKLIRTFKSVIKCEQSIASLMLFHVSVYNDTHYLTTYLLNFLCQFFFDNVNLIFN